MTDKIMPGDMYITEFGAVIRTKCPKDKITDEMIHQRVVAATMACGDTVKVQVLNHERTAVLHYAEFLVYDRRPEMKRVEVNDRESKTFEDVRFAVLRTQDWRDTPAAPSAPEIRWNPGAQAHEVVSGDTVLASFGKAEGGKDAAEAFIRGDKAAA